MEQIEKEKIQSNKSSSYKLLVEQAKLKQATSKVRISEALKRKAGIAIGFSHRNRMTKNKIIIFLSSW